MFVAQLLAVNVELKEVSSAAVLVRAKQVSNLHGEFLVRGTRKL